MVRIKKNVAVFNPCNEDEQVSVIMDAWYPDAKLFSVWNQRGGRQDRVEPLCHRACSDRRSLQGVHMGREEDQDCSEAK